MLPPSTASLCNMARISIGLASVRQRNASRSSSDLICEVSVGGLLSSVAGEFSNAPINSLSLWDMRGDFDVQIIQRGLKDHNHPLYPREIPLPSFVLLVASTTRWVGSVGSIMYTNTALPSSNLCLLTLTRPATSGCLTPHSLCGNVLLNIARILIGLASVRRRNASRSSSDLNVKCRFHIDAVMEICKG